MKISKARLEKGWHAISITKNTAYHVPTDGFFRELFLSTEDKYPKKALICFRGSDGGIKLTKMLSEVFRSHGLTTLALAYVAEEWLPQHFSNISLDFLEKAAAQQIMKRLREHNSPYFFEHLSYDYGSHLFVPMHLVSAKFFKGDHGKNKKASYNARMDSLNKTLEFVTKR